MKWMRVIFRERNVTDPRPIKFPPPGPYWISGEAGDGSSVTIVAYFPKDAWKQHLLTYWPKAQGIDPEEFDEIIFSERFPEPDWWKHREEIRPVQSHQTSVITVRMTADEHKLLKQEARNTGVSLNSFVLNAATNLARSLQADSLEKEHS